MAVGSLATATNASPSPLARAPIEILRNDAEEVPARWFPSLNCALAVVWSSSEATATAPSAGSHGPRGASRRVAPRGPAETHRLEVIVELQPPLRSRPVVRRVFHELLDRSPRHAKLG